MTILGVLYVAFLGGFLIATRVGFENRPSLSTHLLAFFFLVIFGSDTGAYFAGRALGKHKLAPNISPGKTWEGLIGGLTRGAAFAALATVLVLSRTALSGLDPARDRHGRRRRARRSRRKRDETRVGTKDAASILPGHGGFLDRLDSLLFNAPILYYFARFYFS